jgi:catechol 2,3-dioxygenase-like lactoylglutathione lyase family enzyme
MDYRIELIGVPVSDVDRSIAFYRDQAGFVLDHDHRVSGTVRFVQFTPPGSACSIAFGEGISDMAPGSLRGIQMVVADAVEARTELMERGVEASDIDEQPWGKFVYFADPDGNAWALQELPGGR